MFDRSNELHEINNAMDEIRNLFYNVLNYDKDDFSEQKDVAKRQLRFAINDLLNKADNL